MTVPTIKRRLAKIEVRLGRPSAMVAISTWSDKDREEKIATLAAAGRYVAGGALIEIRRVVVDAVDGRRAP